MHAHELQSLAEGARDPHIFKAIFMAGGPGSGKTTVSRRLFAGTGIKSIDLDTFEAMARAAGQTVDYHDTRDYDRFWYLAQRQKANYILGRLGMMIDGTAKDLARILEQKQDLEALGYDTAMVFVNTDLESAQQRVLSRAEREGRLVPEERVTASWLAAQRNLGHLQAAFGRNFFIVDNSGSAPDIAATEKNMRGFLNNPPRSPQAQRWIQQQTGLDHINQRR